MVQPKQRERNGLTSQSSGNRTSSTFKSRLADNQVVVPTPELPVPPQEPVYSEAECGPHDAARVLSLIKAEGVPQLSAIQLLGSWKTESGGAFNQCQGSGDGGIAWGLNSWHPGRRYDMPMGLADQVKWAISVEMPRDCSTCYQQFMNANTIEDARNSIKRSTRWGIEGARWSYADEFAGQFGI